MSSTLNYSKDQLEKLTVRELKDILRPLGLKVIGNKAELIDRIMFYQSTGGKVVAGQKGKPRKSEPVPKVPAPKVYVPKVPVQPSVPKVQSKAPKIPVPNVKQLLQQAPKAPTSKPTPKPLVPGQPVSGKLPPGKLPPPKLPQPPTGQMNISSDIIRISDFYQRVLTNQATLDEMKKALQNVGLPMTGNKEEVKQRLSGYLSKIRLSMPSRIPTLSLIKPNDPQLANVFTQRYNETVNNENIYQGLQISDRLLFYNPQSKQYTNFVVKKIQRDNNGLIEVIETQHPGWSILRHKDQWVAAYQAQAGKKGASYVTGSFAPQLQIQ